MSDEKDIINCVLDYVEGWYTSNGERMNNALSEHLAKRRISIDGEIMEVNKDWMVSETSNGRGAINNPDLGKKEIKILSIEKTIASVKLLSEDFIDYLHLVKSNGNWKIVNALWEFYT